MTDTRKALVANGDHIERNDELCRERGNHRFTDFDAAILALHTYLADCDGPEPSNERSRKLGAEDRDHLLACALTTLAISLPGFYEMGSEEAYAVAAPIIHGWLERWLPYTLGCLPKGAVFKVDAADIDTYRYDPEVDAVKAYGCCDDDEVYVLGDPWEGVEKDETPAPKPPPIGLQRNPKNDYDFARLNLAVYAGDGACLDTARMVFQGLIDINSEVEWVEDIGDGEPIKHRELVCVKEIVELDDLSPALVCQMLHSNGNPRHETRVLRFSSITNVEVG